MKKTHYLKCIEPYFTEVWEGRKPFEFRYNDRDFKIGDEIYLQKYNPETQAYLGFEIRCDITYILQDYIGLKTDYCILGIKITQHLKINP